jgi:hypothetical protein
MAQMKSTMAQRTARKTKKGGTAVSLSAVPLSVAAVLCAIVLFICVIFLWQCPPFPPFRS